MATQLKQGGASALPIARAFVANGGRLLINPKGKLETAGDLARIFGADADPAEARRGFVIARRLHRRLRNPSFARSVAALVAIEGERTSNGWLMLAGEQA